jgi:hypothetical protein
LKFLLIDRFFWVYFDDLKCRCNINGFVVSWVFLPGL